MAETVNLAWDGMKELAANLRNLSLATQNSLAFRASSSAARNVKKSAQANIQSYGLIDTGALIGNVATARLPANGRTASYNIGVRHGTRKQRKTDDDPWYWWLLEFGTVQRPGTPFLTLAFEQEKDKSLELMRKSLVAGIERETAKMRK